jgi:hypothetical protein
MEMKRIKGNNPRSPMVHHPTYRNCTVTIEDPGWLYPTPYECPTCNTTHVFKTTHINLDKNGNGVINEYIYDLLKRNGLLQTLRATKEVTPAPQIIDTGNNVTPEAVMSLERGPVKLPGMNGHKATLLGGN